MKFGIGVLIGFYAGILGAAIVFAKTERILESRTFYQLQSCRMKLDDLTNEVGAYVRAIEEITSGNATINPKGQNQKAGS